MNTTSGEENRPRVIQQEFVSHIDQTSDSPCFSRSSASYFKSFSGPDTRMFASVSAHAADRSKEA
jgi:hypothetical protein